MVDGNDEKLKKLSKQRKVVISELKKMGYLFVPDERGFFTKEDTIVIGELMKIGIKEFKKTYSLLQKHLKYSGFSKKQKCSMAANNIANILICAKTNNVGLKDILKKMAKEKYHLEKKGFWFFKRIISKKNTKDIMVKIKTF